MPKPGTIGRTARPMACLVTLCSLLLVSACTSSPPGTIRLSPTHPDSLSALDVAITFAVPDSGRVRIAFPERWGPEENLGRLVHGLTVYDARSGAPVATESDGRVMILRSRPGRAVTLRYTLRQDTAGEPRWGVQRVPGMRPVMQPDYATLIGHTVLPEIPGMAFEMVFQDFPAGAVTAFSRPVDDAHRTAPAPLGRIRDGIVTLGAFRYAESARDGLRVRTSIRGDWALDDGEIARTVRSVLAAASTMFRDAPFDQYFVALNAMPPLPQGSSVIGTGLDESFFILATPDASAERLTHTIVHELLHEWITRRMGTTDEATDPSRMWFTEGFTEYFTQLVLLKSGLVSIDGFLDGMNDLLAAYQESPVRTMPAGELVDRVWESRQTERLPYQRGALLAFHWDTIARAEAGRPLADAIADLIHAAAAGRDTGTGTMLTDAAIRDAVAAVVGPAFERDYERCIAGGAVIDLERYRTPEGLAVVEGDDGAYAFGVEDGADPDVCAEAIK